MHQTAARRHHSMFQPANRVCQPMGQPTNQQSISKQIQQHHQRIPQQMPQPMPGHQRPLYQQHQSRSMYPQQQQMHSQQQMYSQQQIHSQPMYFQQQQQQQPMHPQQSMYSQQQQQQQLSHQMVNNMNDISQQRYMMNNNRVLDYRMSNMASFDQAQPHSFEGIASDQVPTNAFMRNRTTPIQMSQQQVRTPINFVGYNSQGERVVDPNYYNNSLGHNNEYDFYRECKKMNATQYEASNSHTMDNYASN